MLNIIKKRNIFFAISGVLLIASIAMIAIGGLKFGIDFTGGTLAEIEFKQQPITKEPLQVAFQTVFEKENIQNLELQTVDENKILLRFETIDEIKHKELKTALQEKFGEFEEHRYETIGPTIGKELRSSSITAMIFVIIAIILYIAYTFRKISQPVKSWKYGIAAIIALLHDVIIVTGLFAFLGLTMNVEITLLFITALLTILGFSVNDTIVVFDRTRENLLKDDGKTKFTTIVNTSINETLRRSINTSVTTLIVLLSLLFFGSSSIQWFIVALSAGVIIGTYSSIFVASALLVEIEQRQK